MKTKFKGLSIPEPLFLRVKELSEKHNSAISRVSLALVEYALKQIEEGHFDLKVRPWAVLNDSKAVPTPPNDVVTPPDEPSPGEAINAEIPTESQSAPPTMAAFRKKRGK